jgi:aspartyl aminopeptidase
VKESNNKLFQYLKEGVSPFHVTEACIRELERGGFQPLSMEQPWQLRDYGKYYINHHGTTLVAFTLPQKEDMLPAPDHIPLRMAAAHTDFPCLRIKPHPDIKTRAYLKVNTEVYGGAILNTWLDRPLGVAGRVALASDRCLAPEMRLYDSKRPVLTIPNLAIHMNRDINKGMELNKQTDMLPLFGLEQGDWSFLNFLAQELQVPADKILDYELYVYNAEEPLALGGRQELISSPRIDNISSCAAILTALQQDATGHLNMGILFDHEEVGSRTKQGAGSALLTDVITKIYESMGYSSRQGKDGIYQGLLLSVDVAHALHPNHGEKNDLTNEPVLNGGFVIKEASAQSYATDSEAIAMVMQLAAHHRIPYQKYVNRSDIPGGGTLGAIASALLPMRTVDIGVPILAMHSARELMGEADFHSLYEIIRAWYHQQM